MKTTAALRCVFISVLAIHVSPFIVDPVLTYAGDENCLQIQCVQTNQLLTCDDCIPVIVPDTVYEILLNSLYGSHLVANGFCNVSWTSVKILSIYNNLDDPSAKSIVDYAFDCLHDIEILRLSIGELTILTSNTFYGLLNVRSLYLTDCSRLKTPSLITALSLNTVVPKLNKLILHSMGSVYSGVQLSQEFIDALSLRNITELDLSLSYVHFVNVPFGRLCETLHSLNVSRTRIMYPSSLPRATCAALKVVDFSGAQFPQTIPVPKNMTLKNTVFRFDRWENYEFFSHASVVDVNYMISADHYVYFQNCTFKFSLNNSITEFHFNGYNMPIFELELIFRPNYLTHLDISNNRIESIGANTFRRLEYLKKLDLSNNKLGTTSKDTLRVLFHNNTNLVSLTMAYNGLTYLPQNIFAFNTKLEKLDLRGNKLNQIHFEISNLISLIDLDFKSNLIEYLDASSRRQVDTLYTRKQTSKKVRERNKKFVIDIRGNPFSCKCHSLNFIVWFINSPIFEHSRDDYHCEIDCQHIFMNTSAVTMAKYDCGRSARKLRKLLISTLIPCISLSITIAVTFLLIKRYRNSKKLQKLRRNIAQILDETFEFRFPVFLSYSSVDGKFVEEHIHLPLKVGCDA